MNMLDCQVRKQGGRLSRSECQEALFTVAVEVARLDKRLAEICAAIRLPSHFEEMCEFEVPFTVEGQLYSFIDLVKSEFLQEAVKTLLEAAQLEEETLVEQWKVFKRKEAGHD